LFFRARDTESVDPLGTAGGGSTAWDIQHVSANDGACKISCSVKSRTCVITKPTGTLTIDRVSRDS